MIFPIVFLLWMALVWLVWVSITFSRNSFLVPFFSIPVSNNISIQTWVIIGVILVILYFLFFTKNFESEKFKEYLWKK
jgi:uncharacterized RDD family membrane protein YckC